MISIAQPDLTEAEKKAVVEVIESKRLVQGPQVEKFESGFADYIGTKYGIATSSGTTALTISLMALGIKPGDEVITTPFTFIATATSMRICGAKPVFVDVDPRTFNISPEKVEEALTPETKAVMPVHLYGLAADMTEIKALAEKNDIVIVEDACQAHGAKDGDKKVGGIGDTGCFSFYPTKNMTTGEGGIIVTDDQDVENRCRLIRNHGQKARYNYTQWGYNYRMTEFAGAIGNTQLPRLEEFNSKRRLNAKKLSELLSGIVETPITPPGKTHVFHQYTIKLQTEKARDMLKNYLFEKGIQTEIYYPIALHQIDFLEGRPAGSLENTEALLKTVLSLPVHPGLSDDDIELIAQEVKEGLKA
jgi:dTDP-4-amino-4,6-dideoxygalactose transaminase